MLVLGFQDYHKQAKRFADGLGASYETVAVHRFPDGESKLLLPKQLPSKIIVCRSLNNANHKLIDLLLLSQAVRKRGITKLTLVAPYMCYMRQDAEFHTGEVISQEIIGNFLGSLFDEIITVDPHLHRIQHLSEVINTNRVIALSSAKLMNTFLINESLQPVLVGPDSESEQWVKAVAEQSKLDYVIGQKIRSGDEQVSVSLPEFDYVDRDAVIIDDIASTGQTLAETIKCLHSKGTGNIYCLITHALLSDSTYKQLCSLGVKNIWSTDSVSHSTNIIQLAELLTEAF